MTDRADGQPPSAETVAQATDSGTERIVAAQSESGPQLYEIRIRGHLGQTIRSAFPALRARAEGGDTVLTGVLADQAALYGVLAEAEGLGLELIEFRRLPRPEPLEPSS